VTTPVVTQAVDKEWPREGIGGAECYGLYYKQLERAVERGRKYSMQLKEDEERKRTIEAAVSDPLPLSMLERIEAIGYAKFTKEKEKRLFPYKQDEVLAQELQNNILIHLAGGNSKILAEEMFLEGLIILENNSKLITVKNILCDSGALHGSYMSKQFLARIRNDLGPNQIKKVNSDVRLGDNKTIVAIDEVVILEIMITLEDSPVGSGPKEFIIQEIFSVIETALI